MIAYRTAAPADAHALARMRVAFLTDAGNLPPEHQTEMEAILLEFFTASLADGSFAAWLAFDGEKIVATSGLSFSMIPPSFSDKTGKTAYIMNMYTLPEYRRQGIAAQLLKRIVEEAKARGFPKITLYATEMGRPLYEKFGFEDAHGYMVMRV